MICREGTFICSYHVQFKQVNNEAMPNLTISHVISSSVVLIVGEERCHFSQVELPTSTFFGKLLPATPFFLV